jgi:hypothetical protein
VNVTVHGAPGEAEVAFANRAAALAEPAPV